MNRRFFLFAAPAIVAAPSLMRVSTLPASLTDTPALIVEQADCEPRTWVHVRWNGSDKWEMYSAKSDEQGRCIIHLPNVGDQAIVWG